MHTHMTKPAALTIAEVQAKAPAAFAKAPAQRMTENYTMVRTMDVVSAMEKMGLVPTFAQQRRSDRDKLSARHMIRMAPKNELAKTGRSVGEVFPEIVISNAHNGRASFRMYMGVFRLVCSNGLVVADSTFGFMVRRHTGDIKSIMEQAMDIMQHSSKVLPMVGRMERLVMTDAQRLAYAQGALEARYSVEEGETTSVTAESLLIPRRPEDAKPTLWRTFNTVQENIMRGGLEGKSATGRKTHTRPMNNVGRSLAVNEALWANAVALMA